MTPKRHGVGTYLRKKKNFEREETCAIYFIDTLTVDLQYLKLIGKYANEFEEETDEFYGERKLIVAIINNAMADILVVEKYLPDFTNYRGARCRMLSMIRYAKSARQFLNPNNYCFKVYCKLLDVDPKELSENIWERIEKIRDR